MTTVKIPSNIHTLVWDLDGTLLDSFGIYRDCLNEVLVTLGRPKAPEAVLRNNHHGHIEESIADGLREMKQKVTEAELAEIIKQFYLLDNAYIKDVDHHLFEDAVDLTVSAHHAGKRQVIVTNRPHGKDRGNGSPRNLVANSRLSGIIDDVLCGDDAEYRKPCREVLEARFGATLDVLGGIVVIGDQFVDAEFANNIGCDAILVTRSDKITHLDKLTSWEKYTRIVPSLRSVQVTSRK